MTLGLSHGGGCVLHCYSLPDLELTLGFSSCTVATTLCGSHLCMTTSPSWPPQSQLSSKRAFSLVGITISKWHNCLDADIVEALQCLKSFIHQDLMAQDVVSINDEEQDLDFADEQPANQDITALEVVDASEDLYWGADRDDGDGVAEASGHNMVIEIV